MLHNTNFMTFNYKQVCTNTYPDVKANRLNRHSKTREKGCLKDTLVLRHPLPEEESIVVTSPKTTSATH